jgi:hypothetical protein
MYFSTNLIHPIRNPLLLVTEHRTRDITLSLIRILICSNSVSIHSGASTDSVHLRNLFGQCIYFPKYINQIEMDLVIPNVHSVSGNV